MKRDNFTVEYRKPNVEEYSIPSDPPKESFELETATYSGSKSESRAVLDRIHDEIKEKYQETHGQANTIVLGIQDYIAVDAYLRFEDNIPIERHLPGDIVTVPGRMIHVPAASDKAVWQELVDE